MGINIAGGVTGSKQEVETTSLAARITHRPIDVGALGSYAVSVKSGIMAAGLSANSPILAFRNAGTAVALIKKVRFIAQGLGTGFTAGATVFDLFAARTFTVQDTGGGAVTLTTNNAKLRTSYATCSVVIQASATATLTAGTRTKDANPIRTLLSDVPAAAFSVVLADDIFFEAKPGEHPIVLVPNEGFAIEATVPATGTWTWACGIDWDEVAAY